MIFRHLLGCETIQINCAPGQMTVEAQWPGRIMKTELAGMYGFCPH